MIVSTINNQQPFGTFTNESRSSSENIKLKSHNSQEIVGFEKQLNFEIECEKHIVYHEFHVNEKRKIVLNWTANSEEIEVQHKNKVINIR